MTKQTPSLRERALGYLTRREYSRAELFRKLQPYAGDEDLDALLDDFRQRGWLSDQRYVEQMVHARRGKAGSLKLAHELRSRGISDALIVKAVAEFRQDEETTARDLWRKKYGVPPATREEWARQARFLQGRGFGSELIRKLLRDCPEDND
ncbi:MAG: recombination regulator RecX [Methylobacterium sp.]|nr:recombination regulator RecX [Methylobacterium sp.]